MSVLVSSDLVSQHFGEFDRQTCAYAFRFCEENVWHLARDARISQCSAFVLFVTNPSKECLFFEQRVAAPGKPSLWDYHVVLLALDPVHGVPLVFDLDSRLPFPSPLSDYLTATFLFGRLRLPRALSPSFRVIEVDAFLDRFASDRSHMKERGRWLATPPPWPPICTQTSTMNLEAFLDLESRRAPGEVMGLEQLHARFCASNPGSASGTL